jgi:SMC interacting uncharacterized protein involved in chromosome segregation
VLTEEADALAADLAKIVAFNEQLSNGFRMLTEQTGAALSRTETRGAPLPAITPLLFSPCVFWETEADLSEAHAERARLKRIVDTQEVGPAEAARMGRERESLETQLADARRLHEAAGGALYQTEIAVSRKVEEVSRVLQQYTQLAAATQIIPITARNSNNVNYELALNLNGACAARHRSSIHHSNIVLRLRTAKPDQLLSQDAKHTVRGQLQRFKDAIFAKNVSLGDEELSLRERLDRAQEAVSERDETLNQLGARLKKLEAKCKQDKEVRECRCTSERVF